MRTTAFIIVFLLLSAGKSFLPDSPVNSSTLLIDKKIVFNFPVINAPNTQKKSAVVDTAELKKGSWYSNTIKNIEESEYEIKYDELTHSYASPNRKQNLRAFYTGDQFTLLPRNDSTDKWKLNLHLKGVYSGSQKIYSVSDNPVVTQNGKTIQFNHNNRFITEYINSKEGVRQNFIITQQPEDNPGKIKVELEANKGWFVNKVHDKEIHFAKVTKDGYDKKITYNDLKVWDANGKELEAALEINKNRISINVNTDDALYPVTIDPLSATPNSILDDCNQANANFGLSVSSAGDVNGDGYSDVIIGAYSFDDGFTDEGKAFVYYGSATGLSATPDNTPDDADQASANFGFSVGSAGDINGDGYSDVIIGAYLYNDDFTDEGKAFVYYGSATGLSATPDNTPDDADQATANFGYSVASAGDINGDGYSDVVIGAYLYNDGFTDEGKAFVYYGSATGLSPTPDNTPDDADQATAYFGYCVASAGDVNGDGYSDVIIGAYFYNDDFTDEGKAFVYYGSATGLSATPDNTPDDANQATALFGNSVSCAGDVNGDGYSDVIIGAVLYDDGANTNEGGAFVYYGSSTGLSLTPDNTPDDANQATALFGASVSCAGDINGDGYGDVIIGSSGYDDGANTNEGRAFVYYGSSTGLSNTPNTTPDDANQAFAQFGLSVAGAGDVNGDGYSDVIIGANGYDDGVNTDEGYAFVYHGNPDGLKTTSNWQVLEAQVGANYGINVASAGDVNSDGFSDVIVGAYIYNQAFNDDGKAYLYLGSATGLSTTASWTASGTMTDEYFGRCVSSAGDVNGDGYSDVIVGAYGYSNGQSQEGRVYLYYGSSGGLSGTAAWSYENNVATSVLGVSVATAGDVNGDGYSDLIVGGPQYANGEANEGIAYVFYGTSTVPASTANWSVEGNQVGAFYGASVASLGDVNGDGYCDVIVGANTYDDGFVDEGKVFAYYGSPTGLSATANWTAKSNQTSAQFGICVAAAGDVNGDGFGDAIIGAHLYNDPTVDEGAAFVYYGSSTGLSATANWTAENNSGNSYYGYSVSSAGDVNGDGYSDVLIGSRNWSFGQTNEGGLYCYHGSSTGLSSTVSWFFESNTAGTLLGNSVSSAGDVNGDGYSDVIAGAPYYIDPNRNGAAFVYYGNNNTGLRNNLRLYNQDLVTPIQQSSIAPALFGAGLYAKSPLGRQKGKLVWETVKNGQPFSGNPITNSTAYLSQQPAYLDLGLTGTELTHQIAKQFNSRVTYIRARVKYDLVTAITGQVYGPWRYPESFLRGNRDIGAVVLPVKFISFVALKQNEDVLLKWITTDETAGTEYEVQHSTDGIHFQTIKNITGLGNNPNQYEWLHTNPSMGKNFYRIRAVENGKEAFTVIRQLNFDKNNRLIVYPNPATSGSQLKIELTNNSTSGNLSVELFTINGQIKASYLIVPGSNTINITLPELTAGVYIVKLTKNNKETYSGSFVVVQ